LPSKEGVRTVAREELGRTVFGRVELAEILNRGVVSMAGPVIFFVLSKETQPPFDQVFIASCTGVKVPLLEAKIPKVWALLLLGSQSCIATLPEAMFRLRILSTIAFRAKELTPSLCRPLPT
jgi:hypothetical protein